MCRDCCQKKAERLLTLCPKILDSPVPDCSSSYSGFRWNKYILHVTEIHGPKDEYCEVPGFLDTGTLTPVRLYQHQRRTHYVVIPICNRWLYMDNRSETGALLKHQVHNHPSIFGLITDDGNLNEDQLLQRAFETDDVSFAAEEAEAESENEGEEEEEQEYEHEYEARFLFDMFETGQNVSRIVVPFRNY